MKTLIFNGSPRSNGDTKALINKMISKLDGDVMVVNAYDSKIKPCIDCRYCWKNAGCSIQDDMQAIYDYIETCDNVVIASPIYFSELTGPLLSLASRLQIYFCSRYFRKEEIIKNMKNGGVILVGGGDGDPERAFSTASTILRHMNVENIADIICSHNTNNLSASKDLNALNLVEELACMFNKKIHKV